MMRFSIIRTILPVSIVVMLLTGAAFVASYLQQIRQRDEIFELEKALDEVYRIQLTESRLASEAYHYIVTGRDHNRNAFEKELAEIQEHLAVLESYDLESMAIRSLEPGTSRLREWINRLKSLVEPGPLTTKEEANNYMRSSAYVELRHQIFEQFESFETEASTVRGKMMLRLARLTQVSMVSFLVMLLLAVVFFVLTYRVNAARMRQAYQLQLQRKEQEFETSFVYALVGKAIIDEYGRIVRLNARLCQMLGYSEPELKQRNFFELSPDSEKPKDDATMDRLREAEFFLNEREKEMTHASGHSVWVKQSLAMLPSADLKQAHFIVQLKDISVEKENWRRLQDSNIELEQFAYTASHDLKEPLRMIDGFMKLLEKNYGEKLDDSARKYIHFASDGARRMNQLLEDLLTYSRATRLSAASELTDLNQVLSEIKKAYQPLIDEKRASLSWSDLPTVWVPAVAVKTVLQNLISNSLKYQQPNKPPQINIEAVDKGNRWCIAVNDDGIGIEPEFHDRVFGVFQRLHSRQEIEGSGIGLATCKRLVEKWGGHIGIVSEKGMGSQFYFTIPKQES
ncbi:MAG: sensor histidine kinase [Chitinophagaceae bacterium]